MAMAIQPLSPHGPQINRMTGAVMARNVPKRSTRTSGMTFRAAFHIPSFACVDVRAN